MKKKTRKKIGNLVLKATLLITGGISIFIISVRLGLWGSIPNMKEVQELSQYEASEIYDVNDELIGKFYLSNRQPIPYSDIPQHTIDALLATEDVRFYDHNGIDTKSLFRVFFKTILMQDASSGGGSTITQQLAKNLFSRENYGFLTLPVVKTKEMIVARRLEKNYSKKEIIELYFNTVPFSGNTYGIESAALKYFNKKTIELTPTEAATLIGTLKATYTYDPNRFPERNIKRRNIVLHQMHKYEFLTDTEYKKHIQDSLKLDYGHYDEQHGLAPYFREELRNKMLAWCKENKTKDAPYNLYTSGLKIYTTLDKTLQQYAEEAIKEHLGKLQKTFEKEYGKSAPWLTNEALVTSIVKKTQAYKKLKAKDLSEEATLDSLSVKRKMWLYDIDGKKEVAASTIDSVQHYLKFLNAGMLSIDPQSGAIKSWIGGVDFEHFKYDHVKKSKRQVGSTFKPIVYTTALEQGVKPCDYFSAREVEYENMEGWSPSNSGDVDEKYLNYSLQTALTKSINTVSVKVLEEAGIENTIALAEKLGITSTLPKVPSLALGTAELSVSEMAGAYAAYVNDSKPVSPYYLLKVENKKGELLEEFKQKDTLQPAFSEITRQIMIEMMQSVVNNGTASRMRHTYGLRNDIAGKTGTTQSNKDAWFVSVMPKLVTVTWVGNDDHRIGFKTTRTGQGANAALPIAAKLFQKMNKDTTFNSITKARFKTPNATVVEMLDCEPTKRDGFFKRLFTNPDKKKKSNFKTKKN
ncbi:penicillin-binding protein 1A [Marixanthomonas ophiurae]|uniref:Penicillin-binding protein n=1 Tax=Marixanthomonas ophiurae TaxID=387659 RepID=A0A3E1Q9B5_9FLAO|nr:transglycosylase domain-containing protein [Marixanthomonas ophiurae]RFN58723.1 penicillin-binding protein [Marixanthomonas ophiurae]